MHDDRYVVIPKYAAYVLIALNVLSAACTVMSALGIG